MRIIAGTARGRRLAVPKTAAEIRPTGDRVRETVFNVLGQWCEGQRVLDLFAGTGAMALEALSRGAAAAVLVDSGREAQGLIERNAASLGMTARVELLRQPVARALEVLARRGERFDLVFCDAPYRLEAGQSVLEALDGGALVAEAGAVVVETGRAEVLPEAVGRLGRVDERRFGDSVVSIFRLT